MKDRLKELFIEKDILEKEIEEDILRYRLRSERGQRRYNNKEATLRHSRWNYIIFRKDFRRYLIDNKMNNSEIPVISINLKF